MKAATRFRSIRSLAPTLMLAALPAYAQSTGSDPWDNAVNVLKTAFTGPIATGLSLVAIVVGGLMFAFGEGQSIQILGSIPPERLIDLDESGVTTSLTRFYGRCLGGKRIHEATPGGHWKILTILGAMSTRGILAAMTIAEPTDSDIFLAYVQQLLSPALQPGDVVVMDNLRPHKMASVREWIEKQGASVLYLPPYSPDLNPIEKAWTKLKQLLRSAKARSQETLEQAIAELLPHITPADAQAWFRLRFGTLQ
jgi:transposase/type IV secretory pathway VirB2 component (pilin)